MNELDDMHTGNPNQKDTISGCKEAFEHSYFRHALQSLQSTMHLF